MIVGGTGLYIQSVLFDYQFSESPADLVFAKVGKDRQKKMEILYLHEQLMEN